VITTKKNRSPAWLLTKRYNEVRGLDQNPYIEEDQTTPWPKEKVQKDKL
jgi:hypothetical protein